jgi:hypothetical protein
MKLFHQRFLLFTFLSLTLSCGITGEDAVTVPAYICVPSFTFQTDSVIEGSNNEKFTDMWISDGGQIIGAVGLPSLLPVQKQGNAEVRIDAGIVLTGQDNQRAIYPLVSSYIESRNLKPGVVDTIRPVFKYVSNIDVKFVEDYDRIGSSLDIDPAFYHPGDTVLKVNDSHALRPGNFSGKVEIAATHQGVLLTSVSSFKMKGYGSPAYLEIDYNSNLPLDIGYAYTSDSLESVIQTIPSNGWRKLYINLTDELRPNKPFLIYIATYNANGIVPAVYFDNIKLLCLKD